MSQEFSVVGKRIPRLDGVAKATGAARYAGDIKLPGMLIGKVLRSPYPHANIKKIDKSKAEKLPGVEAVVTMTEDAVIRKTFDLGLVEVPKAALERPRQYIFNEKARYVGEALAAVAAINESIAEEALELIEVEYEKLPAVFDPEEALKPDAPLVHKRNLAMHFPYAYPEGDVEKAFQEADCVVEGTFRTFKQVQCFLETEAAIASFDANGMLTVWSPCQLAHLGRRELAHIFDMPVGKVRMINPYVGGSFGGKLRLNVEHICVLLAQKAGKPVKLEYSKEEDFTVMETRTPFKYNLKMGFKQDGTLTAIQIKAIAWGGAYSSNAAVAADIFMNMGLGHYRCPNIAAETDIAYTNTTISGAFRGFGNPAAMWGIEQLVDTAAEKLGIDPLEIRLRNIKKAGEPTMGFPIQSTALEECIRVGAERIGWKEKRAKGEGIIRRGVGMATMSHTSGAQPRFLEHSNAFIKFNEDGSVNLVVHPGAPGTGILGTLAQIAAEELGLHAEDVHVVSGDTDITLFDIGSHASRSTYVIGNAVIGAAREAKGQVLERAAKTLGVSADELEVKDRRVYVKSAPEKEISVAEVAHDAIYDHTLQNVNILGKCSFAPTAYSPPTQAAFAEIEVNTETGEVKILRLVIANDSGTSINPTNVEGQLEGGIMQGVGFALTEDYVINKDTGVPTKDFQNYKIPTTLDVPQIELILVEKPDPIGPFGAKGVGEPGLITIAPAIANAIYDAVGVRITDLPITPEKILSALEAK